MESFDGYFDAESRARLRQKREEFGYTRHGMADVLGVEDVTVKRWEEGPTQKVSGMDLQIVGDLLSGRLDEQLRQRSLEERQALVPVPIRCRIEKLAKLYALCACRPDLQQRMLDMLDLEDNNRRKE